MQNICQWLCTKELLCISFSEFVVCGKNCSYMLSNEEKFIERTNEYHWSCSAGGFLLLL